MSAHPPGSAGIRYWFAGVFAAAVLLSGCPGNTSPGSSGPVVLEMKNRKVPLSDLVAQYERQNGPGSFARDPLPRKEEFLKTVADKEALLAVAREQFGPLTQEDLAKLQNGIEQRLLKGLEYHLLKSIYADTATSNRMLARFNRQILCDWLVTDSDSLTRLARAEIVAGRPFAEVARKYSKADPKLVKDGRLDWTTAQQMGRDYGEELFVAERSPGYLSEIRKTPRGYELFQIQEYRPYDLQQDSNGREFMPELVKAIRTHKRLTAWSDSLQKARRFEISDEGVGILFKGMTSYWDSLKTYVQQEKKRPTEFKPPLSRFDATQRKAVVAKFDGETVTIADMMADLAKLTPTMWPNAPDIGAFRDQVTSIGLLRLELKYAREQGIDKDPGYVLENRMEQEKYILSKLEQKVRDSQPEIAAEDMKAYYDSHPEKYRMQDRILLSYLAFKDRNEADRFYRKAADSSSGWWAEQCSKYNRLRPDVFVMSNTPEIDTNNPPPEIAEIVAKARPLNVNDVIAPIKIDKGWAVSRVAFNEHAGMHPFEKVTRSIQTNLAEDRVADEMQKIIDDAKVKYGQKTYPERLQAPQAKG